MIRRTINGVPFKIVSPSIYEVDAYDDDSVIALAVLSFDGEWWTLRVLMKQGHTVTREFVSFDDAVRLLGSRRAA